MTTLDLSMYPDRFAEMLRGQVTLHLRSMTVWSPDDGPPVAEQPTDFVIDVAGGTVMWLSPRGSASVSLDPAQRDALFALGRAAYAQHYGPGHDTAVGRPITSFILDIFDPTTNAHAVVHIIHNHYGGRVAPAPAWIALLDALAEHLRPRLSKGDLDVLIGAKKMLGAEG